MKRMILASVLIVTFSIASFARKLVAEGKTYTAVGDYRIELADNSVIINGQDCKTYIISYVNSPLKVKVVVFKDHKCKRYAVLSEKLSVQYTCNGKYFGVEKLDKTIENQEYRTSDSALNRLEYYRQKVISNGQGSELENTQFIAAFFPMLLNNIHDVVAIR